MNTFALVIFVLMPLAGAALALRQWLLLRSGMRVSARIVGFEKFETDPMSESSKPTLQLPIVEFPDENGRTVRITLIAEAGTMEREAAIGDRVALLYPKGQPRRAKYEDLRAMFLVPGILVAPAVVFVVYIVGALAWGKVFP